MASKYKSSATIISVDDAEGTVMAHDITEIKPGKFKGPAFKKGHIIRKEDLVHLKRLGKEHLYLLEIGDGELHEICFELGIDYENVKGIRKNDTALALVEYSARHGLVPKLIQLCEQLRPNIAW